MHHDLEAIFAAIRAFHGLNDHPGTTLTFRHIATAPQPLDIAATCTVFFVNAIQRRAGHSNGFHRWYAVRANDAGSLLVAEFISAEHRAIYDQAGKLFTEEAA